MVSYNYCPFICELYKDFYIFYTRRPNSMSLVPGSEYEEIIMTNYDPRPYMSSHHTQLNMFPILMNEEGTQHFELIHEPETKNKGGNFP